MNEINETIHLKNLSKGEKYIMKFEEIVNKIITTTETIMEIDGINQGTFNNCTTFKIINTNSIIFKKFEINNKIKYIPNTILKLKLQYGDIFKQ